MSIINNALNGKKVLVTGATGFIGGRLAERLAREEGAIVTGTGRNLDAVPFVQEAGVTLMTADLLDEAAMRRAMEGQEVVFHVAAWLGRHGGEQRAYALNVAATGPGGAAGRRSGRQAICPGELHCRLRPSAQGAAGG